MRKHDRNGWTDLLAELVALALALFLLARFAPEIRALVGIR